MKRPGCCVLCDTEIYEVFQYVTDEGPRFGFPARLGPMLDRGCQLEFLLSDGSEASIACCIECAATLTPADYQRIWTICCDATAFYAQVAGWTDNARRRALWAQIQVWPIALLRKRREGPLPGQLVIDRR